MKYYFFFSYIEKQFNKIDKYMFKSNHLVEKVKLLHKESF